MQPLLLTLDVRYLLTATTPDVGRGLSPQPLAAPAPHSRGSLLPLLCAAGPRDPTETETELCLSVSCGRTGQEGSAAGTEALGAAYLGMV